MFHSFLALTQLYTEMLIASNSRVVFRQNDCKNLAAKWFYSLNNQLLTTLSFTVFKKLSYLIVAIIPYIVIIIKPFIPLSCDGLNNQCIHISLLTLCVFFCNFSMFFSTYKTRAITSL